MSDAPSLPATEAQRLGSALTASAQRRRDDIIPSRPVFDPKPPSGPWYDRFISRNAKALGALATGAFTVVGVIVHSKSTGITAAEWYELLGVGVQTFIVYAVTNKPTS